MFTSQASPESYRIDPTPFSVENPAELDSADLPANQDDNNPFPAGAYHVHPKAFTPSPNPLQPHEYSDGAKRLGTLPPRCQFMFSDGR